MTIHLKYFASTIGGGLISHGANTGDRFVTVCGVVLLVIVFSSIFEPEWW